MNLEPREQPLAIVLVSGGMDSCVTSAMAAQEAVPAFLHVSYGQNTSEREHLAFTEIADYFGIPEDKRLSVELPHLGKIGGSALTDDSMEVPKFHSLEEEEEEQGEKPQTYVPFRNSHILCMAVSWAEVIGATRIYIGAVEEDSAGYPDCREEYFEAFNELIAKGSYAGDKLKILTPVIKFSKADIVKKGSELSAPFHLTWSCYERSDTACGKCDSCLRRLRAFEEAGIEDPIDYVE